jgi:hypothetical protein
LDSWEVLGVWVTRGAAKDLQVLEGRKKHNEMQDLVYFLDIDVIYMMKKYQILVLCGYDLFTTSSIVFMESKLSLLKYSTHIFKESNFKKKKVTEN